MQFQGGRLIYQGRLDAAPNETGTTVSGRVDDRLAAPGVNQHNLRRWLLGVLAASPGLHMHFNGHKLQAPSAGDS